MFCQNCGRENNDKSNFCLYCGKALSPKNTVFSKKLRLIIFMIICTFMVLFFRSYFNERKEAQNTVSKLDEITTVTHDKDRYLFDYNNEWLININEAARTVKLQENLIYDCLSDFFEADDIGNTGEFLFNWEENTIHSSLDCTDDSGSVSFIKYSFDKEEWEVMHDGTWYNLSDSFMKHINDYDLLDSIVNDIKTFENQLNKSGLSVNDLKNLTYSDVVKYYKKHTIKD